MRTVDAGSAREPTNFFERPANALRVACKLNGRGVGQELTLAGNRTLNQLAKKDADIANRHEDNAQHHDGHVAPILIVR